MPIFKKRPPKQTLPPEPNEFNSLWKDYSRKHLVKLATGLSRREQRMTMSQKKMALIAFFILMAVFCAKMLFNAFYEPDTKTPWYLKVPMITRPRTIQIPDSIIQKHKKTLNPLIADTSNSLTK
jgi:hypothetical protein